MYNIIDIKMFFIYYLFLGEYMDYDILKDTKIRMKQCVSIFQNNINSVRIDHVSPVLLDKIYIEYYGVKTRLQSVSNITVENTNTLKITVFDKSMIRAVEKEIFHSDLDVTPLVQDNFIRLIFPSLTEERRKKICKSIQSDAEYSRITIRNIRRDANDILKKYVKEKILTLDVEHVIQNQIQILTDKYIKRINDLLLKQKSDIMKI